MTHDKQEEEQKKNCSYSTVDITAKYHQQSHTTVTEKENVKEILEYYVISIFFFCENLLCP